MVVNTRKIHERHGNLTFLEVTAKVGGVQVIERMKVTKRDSYGSTGAAFFGVSAWRNLVGWVEVVTSLTERPDNVTSAAQAAELAFEILHG